MPSINIWLMNPFLFQNLSQIYFNVHRTNAQLPTYMSWFPDADAIAYDVLIYPWMEIKGYAFSPFCLIARCLKKIWIEKKSILKVTRWLDNTTMVQNTVGDVHSGPSSPVDPTMHISIPQRSCTLASLELVPTNSRLGCFRYNLKLYLQSKDTEKRQFMVKRN